MAEERVQKILARAGYGSRRSAETLIEAGRVTVNGQIVPLGSKADAEKDRILVDGQPVKLVEESVYIALYKPRGVLSTVTAPDPRPTVRDLVDLPGTLFPVGRLDVDSEGLILLTNDGELANRLTHPRYGHEKEYRVLVARHPDEEQLANWRRGVVMEDGYKTAPVDVHVIETLGKGSWLRVVMKEGRKRQIRETGSLLGLPVVRIVRTRIGSLLLGSLKTREWRRLTPEEVVALKGRSGSKTPGRRVVKSSRTTAPKYEPKPRTKTTTRGTPKQGQRAAPRPSSKGSGKPSQKSSFTRSQKGPYKKRKSGE